MTSNYRLIAVEPYADDDAPVQLHKVHYNDDGSLRVHVPIIGVGGDDPDAVLAELQAMVDACAEPVLESVDFPALPPMGAFSVTLSTRRRQKAPPERKTPELRVIPKADKCDPDPE